jgi:hypothetical protein
MKTILIIAFLAITAGAADSLVADSLKGAHTLSLQTGFVMGYPAPSLDNYPSIAIEEIGVMAGMEYLISLRRSPGSVYISEFGLALQYYRTEAFAFFISDPDSGFIGQDEGYMWGLRLIPAYHQVIVFTPKIHAFAGLGAGGEWARQKQKVMPVTNLGFNTPLFQSDANPDVYRMLYRGETGLRLKQIWPHQHIELGWQGLWSPRLLLKPNTATRFWSEFRLAWQIDIL